MSDQPQGGRISVVADSCSIPVIGLAIALAALSSTLGMRADAAEIHAEIEVFFNSALQAPRSIGRREQTIENPVGSIHEDLVAGMGLAGGAGNATVGLGWMRLNAFTDAFSDYESGSVSNINTSVFGRFIDEVTITPANPALVGQTGRATFAVRVEGLLATDDPNSDARVRVYLNSRSSFDLQYDEPGQLDETIEFSRIVTFGQPFELIVGLEAHAHSFGENALSREPIVGPSTFAEADIGDTLEWLGTMRVDDPFDNEITDYTMTAVSGTDYRNAIQAPAVPEPASLVLIACGLLMVASSRRPAIGIQVFKGGQRLASVVHRH